MLSSSSGKMEPYPNYFAYINLVDMIVDFVSEAKEPNSFSSNTDIMGMSSQAVRDFCSLVHIKHFASKAPRNVSCCLHKIKLGKLFELLPV